MLFNFNFVCKYAVTFVGMVTMNL